MLRKEVSKMPARLKKPHRWMEVDRTDYEELYKFAESQLLRLDEASTSIASIDNAYKNLKVDYDAVFEAYNKLIDMHRTLPKGCFQIPDRRR